MRLTPLWNWVLVRSVAFEKSSTLAVVELSADAPDKGEVVMMGPDVPEGMFDVGTIVMFGKYCGIPGDEDLHLVRAEDILAIVEDAPILRKGRYDAAGAPVLL